MAADDRVDDRQAQPAPVVAGSGLAWDAPEPVEDASLVVACDARPVVGDLDQYRRGGGGVRGRLDPVPVPLPDGVVPPAGAPAQEITGVTFDPTGNYLAVTSRGSQSGAFFEVGGDGSDGSDGGDGSDGQLTPWGRPVGIDPATFGGQFSPDGRHFYVTNVRGADDEYRPVSTTLDDSRRLRGLRPGRRAGSDRNGVGAGHAPDRRCGLDADLAGRAGGQCGRPLRRPANLQSTSQPPDSALFRPVTTISLWERDEATGGLTKIGDTEFEGLLPEGLDGMLALLHPPEQAEPNDDQAEAAGDDRHGERGSERVQRLKSDWSTGCFRQATRGAVARGLAPCRARCRAARSTRA